MTTNIVIQNSLEEVKDSIISTSWDIKNYVDYKDNQLTTTVLDNLVNDEEFIEKVQVSTFSTIVSNLQVEAKQNALSISIKNDILKTTLKKSNLYVDLIQGDGDDTDI